MRRCQACEVSGLRCDRPRGHPGWHRAGYPQPGAKPNLGGALWSHDHGDHRKTSLSREADPARLCLDDKVIAGDIAKLAAEKHPRDRWRALRLAAEEAILVERRRWLAWAVIQRGRGR